MNYDTGKFGIKDLQKSLNYIKNNGVSGVLSHVKYKMSGPGLAYNGWYKDSHETDEEELELQRQTDFSYKPRISIIVPVYMTPEYFLRAMIQSVQRQTYPNWELILIDGSQVAPGKGDNKELSVYEKIYSLETEKVIRQFADEDDRIKYHLMEENMGISGNSNYGISHSTGEYIAILNHDDIITDDALFCFVKELQEVPYEVLYCDEDKMSEDGTKYSDPMLKPDYSPDLLLSYNYIKHFQVLKATLARAVEGFHSAFDGAQDYDFILRCCENVQSPSMIKHIPRVLYHWRKNNRSKDTSKMALAHDMGKKALAEHIKRMKVYGTVADTGIRELHKVRYETWGNPFISIVVCSVGNLEYMKKLITSLFEKARYSNFEVIIVDRDASDETLLSYYRRMENIRKNIKVFINENLATMHSMRNYGASMAKGDYILFLDSNLEVMDFTAIGDMLGMCIREDVGIVSGVLYNDNQTTFQKGMLVGVNGVATYMHRGVKKGDRSYMMLNRANTNHSAVSASCMLVKTSLYNKVGGFSDKYKTDITDVDF
ncbi:MAG: glycosyltransferase, partial [Lachnospiraceae bacterium]|nr:glycosyltransferase [Lachnospiraceae bacterium]